MRITKLNINKKEKKMENKIVENLIGKPVIVRANVAGVHAGIVVAVDFKHNVIQLSTTRRLWKIYTRDTTGSISDVAANGLKPDADHHIGAIMKSVTIPNPSGLEIAEMTEEAWKSVLEYSK
jgi:hypothetical protein